MKFRCLIETRVKENRAERIVSSVFRNWSTISNYENHRLGRIWVVWIPGVRVTPCFKSNQLITCSVLLEGMEEEFFCSFVYASNFPEERRELWNDLKDHQNLPLFKDKPWLVLGDFNEILDLEEYSGINAPSVTTGMREFQDMRRYCSLLDMKAHGPHLTWSNKRKDDLIRKKLDQTLVNDVWSSKYPHSYCVFEAGGCSDHLRCRFQIQPTPPKPKRPFKFTNAVVESPSFLPLIANYWGNTVPLHPSTSALFHLSKKLKNLKPALRKFSRDTVGDITKRTKEAFDILCRYQTDVMTNPTPSLLDEEARAFDKWQLLSSIEEKVLSQKAKMHWCKVGDGNNKSFHNSAKIRAAKNPIKEIQKEDGTVLTTQEDIKAEAVDYFQGFLAKHIDSNRGMEVDELKRLMRFQCEEADRDLLIHEVTTMEIKHVLFAMASNKSPGPDGFTCEFYKAAWDIVGEDFVIAVKSFFKTGFLPKGINSTILALMPKKKDSKTMKDYRPISCCNVIYKVISKILANRLKLILPKFISPNQSAFVKDRLLMENVLMASELVKSYHKSAVSARCAIKIGISKAYDTVQCPFLLSVLTALGFPGDYIIWIDKSFSLASFSVQVNRELSGYLNSKRGLRQGCAFSPYLFVICMEVLSKLLDRAATTRKFGYHPYCHDLKITHLCFADDLLIFSDGQRQSIDGILEVFKRFSEASGLHISMEKSTLYLAGLRNDAKQEVLSHFTFAAGDLPIRYLWLPLMTKQMTVHDYTPLIERIRTRISSWTACFLSFAGRLQLIASVIHRLTNFWISAFRLPRKCIQEIDRLCSTFLWSGP